MVANRQKITLEPSAIRYLQIVVVQVFSISVFSLVCDVVTNFFLMSINEEM